MEHKQQRKEKGIFRKTWNFLWKDDSLASWIVSIVLAFIIVKFIFFPAMSFLLSTKLPLVVVESSSMYHQGGSLIKILTGFSVTNQDSLENWWKTNSVWYDKNNITIKDAEKWSFENGIDKGDIIVVKGTKIEKLKVGDVIIFNANQKHPIIHRVVKIKQENNESRTILFETKGDNNSDQLYIEKSIPENVIVGKAIARIPKIGWLKLLFVEIVNAFR